MKHYFPDVLPADAEVLLNGFKPLSRREFSRQIRRSFRLVLRDESLAIDYNSFYRDSIFALDDRGQFVINPNGHAKKKPLNAFHQWVLVNIADLFSRCRSESTVIYQLTHSSNLYTPLNFLEELRNAQKNDQKLQQNRGRSRINYVARPQWQRGSTLKRRPHRTA